MKVKQLENKTNGRMTEQELDELLKDGHVKLDGNNLIERLVLTKLYDNYVIFTNEYGYEDLPISALKSYPSKKTPDFEPIKIELTIESIDELEDLYYDMDGWDEAHEQFYDFISNLVQKNKK